MKLSAIINHRHFIAILAITMLITLNSKGQSFLDELPASFEEVNSLNLQTKTLIVEQPIVNNYSGVENDLKVRLPRNTPVQRFETYMGNYGISAADFLTRGTYILPTTRANQGVGNPRVDLGFEPKFILPMPKAEDLQKFVFVKINLFKN